jgi:hypothetical protein
MALKRRNFFAIFGFCLLLTMLPLTSSVNAAALAQQGSAPTLQGACLQAPTNLDPTTLTREQLRAYGLPDEYAHTPAGKQEWLQTIARLKQDRHVCSASLSAADQAWFQAPSHSASFAARNQARFQPLAQSDLRPSVAMSPCGLNPPGNGQGCDLPDQAGNWALGSQNQYIYTSTKYNLPCPQNTNSINNGQASWWIGLGGGLGDAGDVLVQAGNEIHIDAQGHVSFVGFFESTGLLNGRPFDDIDSFSMPSAKCSSSMYVYLSDTGGDYFIMDGGGVNLTQLFSSWPVSDGMTDECAAERIFDHKHGYWLIFVDFNYIAFTNCEVNSDPIGKVRHYYTSMIDSNGNVLAYPGPISSSGLNFNMNWKQVGCTC